MRYGGTVSKGKSGGRWWGRNGWRGWWDWTLTDPLVLLVWHCWGWSHLSQGPVLPKAFITVNDVMGFIKGLSVLIYFWMYSICPSPFPLGCEITSPHVPLPLAGLIKYLAVLSLSPSLGIAYHIMSQLCISGLWEVIKICSDLSLKPNHHEVDDKSCV